MRLPATTQHVRFTRFSENQANESNAFFIYNNSIQRNPDHKTNPSYRINHWVYRLDIAFDTS